MKTKRDVEKLARKLGAEIEINIDCPGGMFGNNVSLDCEAVAPVGFHWREDPHSLVAVQYAGDPRGEAWQDLFDRMSSGVVRCDDPDYPCEFFARDGECEFWLIEE